jgi:hypothetical protein
VPAHGVDLGAGQGVVDDPKRAEAEPFGQPGGVEREGVPAGEGPGLE